MLTGALLLKQKGVSSAAPSIDMKAFYRKRIPRVLLPFVIWSAVYYVWPWLVGLAGYGEATVAMFFPWAETMSCDWAPAAERLWRAPFTFSYVACHLWYIYLLIGLYLYIPVLNAWVERATRRQKQTVLTLWAASTFLPYVHEFVSPYSFGTCDWNAFGTFYYFSGFSGYLLLGHYLQHETRLPSLGITLSWAVPALVAGYAVSLMGYRHMLTLPSPTPSQIELFWTYCTPNVAAMSAAVFCLLRRIRVSHDIVRGLLEQLTACGFGIYMIHYLFVGPVFEWVSGLGVSVWLRVPVAGLVVLAASWSAVYGLRRLLGRRAGRVLLG